MNYYLFQLLDGAELSEVQQDLEKKGLQDLFIIEDDLSGATLIGGHSKKEVETQNALLLERKKAVVDWEEQWALFAENFRDGKAHIQIGEKTLILAPGPGFGDLSHPTTYLMLKMLKAELLGESIVDIGTGSGILALAALLLGARSAVGIDLDEKALEHAKKNAKLNSLGAVFSKKLPTNLSKHNLFLMNMIFPEQKEFDPQRLNPFAKKWITSGILKSQKKEYLAHTKKWEWNLLETHSHLGWCGFVFATKAQ